MVVDEDSERELANLLEYVRSSRGFDFTGYKRASLGRRVKKRLHDVGLEKFSDYLNYLEVQPEEFKNLFNTVLINVTSFFRDPESWRFLAREVVPQLLASKGPNGPIRVWCPGVASGEEAYTVAMVLAEELGEEGLRERVKIYGTDVDEESLNLARQASYTEQQVEAIPKELREKYLERVNRRWTFRRELRRIAIFGRHDLVQDAPISRVDLLICRNTLMYFGSEAQTRILNRFHFALNSQGFLFLGRVEMLLTRAHLFKPLDIKHRLFSKVAQPHYRVPAGALERDEGAVVAEQPGNEQRIRELALEAAPVTQLVVDTQGFLVAANERARTMFALGAGDIGRPLRDLEVSYRPVDLRSLIDNAFEHKHPVGVVGAEWPRSSGETYYLDVQVVPILDGHEGLLGASIAVLDVSRLRQLQDENLRVRQELETYSEELQAANEELETTNEELQSTNEELETTNEELQSSNEELETMNEELQSTNQELETINDELLQRSDELLQVSLYRDGILASLNDGVAVLDRDLRVQVWNRRAADLWGLHEDEARGQYFLNLDIGLPVADLRKPLLDCLANEGDLDTVVHATDRRGRPLDCRVRCESLLGIAKELLGIILIMEVCDEGARGS